MKKIFITIAACLALLAPWVLFAEETVCGKIYDTDINGVAYKISFFQGPFSGGLCSGYASVYVNSEFYDNYPFIQQPSGFVEIDGLANFYPTETGLVLIIGGLILLTQEVPE